MACCWMARRRWLRDGETFAIAAGVLRRPIAQWGHSEKLTGGGHGTGSDTGNGGRGRGRCKVV